MTPRSASNAYARMVTKSGDVVWSRRRRRRLPLEVGQLLRLTRIRAGLSQRLLAERTVEVAQVVRQRRRTTAEPLRGQSSGVAYSMVGRLERGERAPSVRTARLLIAALGLSKWHGLGRDLLRHSSPARAQRRRFKATVDSKPLAGLVNGLASGALSEVRRTIADLPGRAQRERDAGLRKQKGGWPRRHKGRGRGSRWW